MFCSKCGKEIFDEAVVCPNCGCQTSNYKTQAPQENPTPQTVPVQPSVDVEKNKSTGKTLGIIGIVVGIFIPLVGWICGGIGLSKLNAVLNVSMDDKEAISIKNINVGAIVVASIAFVINAIAIYNGLIF